MERTGAEAEPPEYVFLCATKRSLVVLSGGALLESIQSPAPKTKDRTVRDCWKMQDRRYIARPTYCFILMYTCGLTCRAPNYLLNHVIPVSAIVSRQRLRSAQQNTCGPTLQTDHIRPSSIFCCGSHSVEQSSCRIQRPDNQRCLLPTAFKDSSVRTTASAP